MKILCEGPGPHIPADGVLGESDKLVRGMRCASESCALPSDPSADRAARTQDRLEQALTQLRPAAFDALTAAQKLSLIRLILVALIRHVLSRNEEDAA